MCLSRKTKRSVVALLYGITFAVVVPSAVSTNVGGCTPTDVVATALGPCIGFESYDTVSSSVDQHFWSGDVDWTSTDRSGVRPVNYCSGLFGHHGDDED